MALNRGNENMLNFTVHNIVGMSRWPKLIIFPIYIFSVEFCDDGNLLNGDGCDVKCRIEELFHCTGLCLFLAQIYVSVQFILNETRNWRHEVKFKSMDSVCTCSSAQVEFSTVKRSFSSNLLFIHKVA